MNNSLPSRKNRKSPSMRQTDCAMRRRSFFELLEPRMMLTAAGDLKTPSYLRDLLQPHLDAISGVTVVTHGFQFGADSGDSLLPLGAAIRDRADAENSGGASAWLLDYDVRDDGAVGGFDFDLTDDDDAKVENVANGSRTSTAQPTEVVLLFDWAPESNEISTGWGEAAGDALFSMLVGLGLVDLTLGATNPSLHFVGHSFGTAVTSEAVERLAFYNVLVDQVTFLDPHDFQEDGIPSHDLAKCELR
jgi:hypothetical protein